MPDECARGPDRFRALRAVGAGPSIDRETDPLGWNRVVEQAAPPPVPSRPPDAVRDRTAWRWWDDVRPSA